MAGEMTKKKFNAMNIQTVKPAEPATLTTGDMELLKDHFKLLKGLEIKKVPIKKYLKMDQKIVPKLNTAHAIRKLCIKKRKTNMDEFVYTEIKQREKIFNANRIDKVRKKRRKQFTLNKAFHLRWKNTRGFPILNGFYEESALKTGKPPFVVPVHYKPFNAYWQADWAEQEFIFLDDNSNGSSTTPASTAGTGLTTGLTTAFTQNPSVKHDVNENTNANTTNVSSTIKTTAALKLVTSVVSTGL